MFWISAAVFFSATIMFWLFGSADIQPWNDYDQVKKVANISEEEKQINDVTVKESATEDEAEENERL